MKILKNIFLLSILAVSAVSCLNKGYYNVSYDILSTFEFPDSDHEKIFKDTGVFKPMNGFIYADALFANKGVGDKQENWKYDGGFFLSSLMDSTVAPNPPMDTVKENGKPKKDENGQVILKPHVYSPFSVCAKFNPKMPSRSFSIFEQNPNADLMPKQHLIYYYANSYSLMTPKGCMIANTTENVNAIKYGIKDVQDKFTEGDWMKITATGYRDDAVTDTAQFYLADYRGKEKCVAGWKEWDLSKLGQVHYIKFNIEVSQGKEAVAKRFCLDDYFAHVDINR